MPAQIPLCVNPEGTLFRTSPTLEALLRLAKQRPASLWQVPVWLLRGRAALKHELAARVRLDFASLPRNEALVSYLQQERQNGRALVLVTGEEAAWAEAMAKPFPWIDRLVCPKTGAPGHRAGVASLLRDQFGAKQFDYAGDARSSRHLEAGARKIILVQRVNGRPPAAEVEKAFPRPSVRLADWVRALRVYQWSKNLLLFAPLLFAHGWTDLERLRWVTLGFASFCLCASSVYILNDLMDLESDRHHPNKRYRPFAAGTVPLGHGLIAAPVLLALALALAAALSTSFLLCLALYYFLTTAYSLVLKQVAILDVLVLAGLYGLRVIAGGRAGEIRITDWLLAFSMFLFVSLAFVKRFTELQLARFENRETLKGRDYHTGDIELVSTMGVASGYLAVLVLAFYINNPAVEQLYERPAALWLACPVLLYWISRMWLLAHRKALHGDPIVFTLTDRQSWLVGIIFLLIAAAASPLPPK